MKTDAALARPRLLTSETLGRNPSQGEGSVTVEPGRNKERPARSPSRREAEREVFNALVTDAGLLDLAFEKGAKEFAAAAEAKVREYLEREPLRPRNRKTRPGPPRSNGSSKPRRKGFTSHFTPRRSSGRSSRAAIPRSTARRSRRRWQPKVCSPTSLQSTLRLSGRASTTGGRQDAQGLIQVFDA